MKINNLSILNSKLRIHELQVFYYYQLNLVRKYILIGKNIAYRLFHPLKSPVFAKMFIFYLLFIGSLIKLLLLEQRKTY